MLISNDCFLHNLFLWFSILEKVVRLLLSAAICCVIFTNWTKHWGRGQGLNHLWSNCKENIPWEISAPGAWRCQEADYLLFLTLTVIRCLCPVTAGAWCTATGHTLCLASLYLHHMHILLLYYFTKYQDLQLALSFNTLILGFHGAVGWSPGPSAIKVGSQPHLRHPQPRYRYWCLLTSGVTWEGHKAGSRVLLVLQRNYKLFKYQVPIERFIVSN